VCLLLAAPAVACPKPCLLKPPRIAKLDALPALLRVFPKREKRDEIEMPWIWRVLRERVYDRLPRYERKKVLFIVSPVVVNSPSDTVPGVGLAGGF